MYYGLINSMNRLAPSNPLWNNLKAYYTADSTSNDALATHNGTLINGATYASGKINNGFSLDGVNDYISISPSFGSSFSIPSLAHSYNAWIYPTNVSDTYNFIIQNGTNSIGTSLLLNLNKICFFYAGGNNLVNSNATLTANTWNMVTVVYNGSGQVSFYLNGAFSNTETAVWTQGVLTNSTWIGSFVGAAHFFNGIIDEVSAWSKALTATEVTELYNSGSGKQYHL